MVEAAVVMHWLQELQNALGPYPWAYTALTLGGLAVVAALANWVTKRILLRGLRRLLNRLPGADTAAWVALGIAVLLALQTLLLRRKYPGGLLPNPARAPD